MTRSFIEQFLVSKRMINQSLLGKILITSLLLTTTACSTYNNKFDCPAGSGLGCTPARKVHRIIENGEVKQKIAEVHGSQSVKVKVDSPLVYRSSLPYLNVWLAPQADDNGNISQERYVQLVTQE